MCIKQYVDIGDIKKTSLPAWKGSALNIIAFYSQKKKKKKPCGHSLGTALKLLTVFPSLWLCGSLLYFSYTLNMLMETMSRFALSCVKTRCPPAGDTSAPWRTISPRSADMILLQLDSKIRNACRKWKTRFITADDIESSPIEKKAAETFFKCVL